MVFGVDQHCARCKAKSSDDLGRAPKKIVRIRHTDQMILDETCIEERAVVVVA